MLSESRFWKLFYNVFTFRESEAPPLQTIQLMKRDLRQGKWNSRDLAKKYRRIRKSASRLRRPDAKDVFSELESLIEDESEQKSDFKCDLQKIMCGVDLDEFSSEKHFLREYLEEKNKERRIAIRDALMDILEESEEEIREKDYDFDSLREKYENGSEEEVVRLLRDLYDYLYRQGWHHRDLSDLTQHMRFHDDYLEFLREILEKESFDATFVFFLPNLKVEEEHTDVGSIKRLAPPGTYDINGLRDLYPYGDVDESEFSPNKSNHSPVKPDWEGDLDENAKERLERDRRQKDISYQLSHSSMIVLEATGFHTYARTERAFELLSEFLDACSYKSSLSRVEDPQYLDRAFYLHWRPDGEIYTTLSSRADSSSPIRIRESDILSARHMLDAINSDSELSDNLRRGLHLYRKANNMYREEDKLVYYIASLETIASPGQTYMDETISNLCTIASLYDIPENRDLIKDAYEARNSSIHAGVKPDQAESLADFLRMQLSKGLTQLAHCIHNTECKTVPEFVSLTQEAREEYNKRLRIELQGNSLYTNTVYKFNTTIEEKNFDIDLQGCYGFIDVGGEIVPRITISSLKCENYQDDHVSSTGHRSITVRESGLDLTFYNVHIPRQAGVASANGFFQYISPLNVTAQGVKINQRH